MKISNRYLVTNLTDICDCELYISEVFSIKKVLIKNIIHDRLEYADTHYQHNDSEMEEHEYIFKQDINVEDKEEFLIFQSDSLQDCLDFTKLHLTVLKYNI